MESFFSLPSNTKCLVSFQTLINPSILLNIIEYNNYFHMIFHLLKHPQDHNLQFQLYHQNNGTYYF